MTEWKPTSKFEDDIQRSFGTPDVRAEFKHTLYIRLISQPITNQKKQTAFLRLQTGWKVAFVILIALVITIFIIGPRQVYAEIRQLFGYVPDVGIIEQQNGLRVLAEPVSQTRNGVTVSVNQAILTQTETKILYGVAGIPLTAYAQDESISGCNQHEYLRLPNGTQIQITAPIPSDVEEAILVIPCIANTLPGSTPENWEIPLNFVAASPDFKVLPVVEVTNTSPNLSASSTEINSSNEPAYYASVSVDKMIETETGYILMGRVLPNLPEGSWFQITGPFVIQDANGKQVSYSLPTDVQLPDLTTLPKGSSEWAVEFEGEGVKFPITLSVSGVAMKPLDPQANAKVCVDVGANPQPGQTWELNQQVELAGKNFQLVSLIANTDGYSFHFELGEELASIDVAIEGYQADGAGGGGVNTSLMYSSLPKGLLTIVLSNPVVKTPVQTWQASWQPEQIREFPAKASAGICFDANSLPTLPLLPVETEGRLTLTQLNPQVRVISVKLDGSDLQVLANNSAQAALSPDGSMLASMPAEGITVENLQTGESFTIEGTIGRDNYWSPDGHWLATINANNGYGISVINLSTHALTQLSNLGTESLAGWSADSANLYYAIPGATGDGFLLRKVDVATGGTQDLFVLEYSSLKAPMPRISPNGNWIAYRAKDNSSLYIKPMDGSSARLVLDNPANAINGIAWSQNSQILAVSLITSDFPEGQVVLLNPDNCSAYRLQNVMGIVEGVFLP